MSAPLKVLITGASGQLGRALSSTVSSAVSLHTATHAELDISDHDAVQRYVMALRPDVIINAAAYTAVDKAESETEQALAINVTGPRNLSLAAGELGHTRLIHISTDFVFDGEANQPYAVDAMPNPLNVYGWTKYQGECAVREGMGENALIVRTSWLYDKAGKNFLLTMLGLMNEHGSVRVVADQIGTPTAAASLASVVWQCVAYPELSGIYHWSDAGIASWYDFAVAIAEEAAALGLLQRAVQVLPIATCDYPTPAKRPAFSVMDKSKTYADLKLTPIHWRVQLRKVLGAMQRV